MAKKGANALIEFGADDVLEPACLCVSLGVVDGKSVFEETFGQPMPAHHTACALAAHRCKLRFAISQFDQMPLAHAAQGSCRRLAGKNGLIGRDLNPVHACYHDMIASTGVDNQELTVGPERSRI